MDRIFRGGKARSALNGWHATRDGSSSCSGYAGTTRQSKGKVWSTKGRTQTSQANTEVVPYDGKRSSCRRSPRTPELRPPGNSRVTQPAQVVHHLGRKWVLPVNHAWRQDSSISFLSGSVLGTALWASQGSAPTRTRKEPQQRKQQPQSLSGGASNKGSMRIIPKRLWISSLDARALQM